MAHDIKPPPPRAAVVICMDGAEVMLRVSVESPSVGLHAVSASLTPREARRIGERLIVAADTVEKGK